MIGSFSIGSAPIASQGKQNVYALITGSSVLVGTADVIAQANVNPSTIVLASAFEIEGGFVVGNSNLSAAEIIGQIFGASAVTAQARLVSGAAVAGLSTIVEIFATLIAQGSLEGDTALIAFPFYPAYRKWEAETTLFNYSGSLIEESDSAFDQAGRVVFVGQRTIEKVEQIWLYWFDPTVNKFVFSFIANGRNPRLILDDPYDTTNSDILLFYINQNQQLVYHQQRDRYATEIITPITAEANSYVDLYLQDVVKGRDSRLVILVAWHTINTGRWFYQRLESSLYPIVLDVDSLVALSGGVRSAAVDNIIQDKLLDVENLEPTASVQSASNDLIVQDVTTFDLEALQPIAAVESGAVDQVIFDVTTFDLEALQPVAAVESGAVDLVVIDEVLFDIGNLQPTASVQSGLLEIV